jgi:hypothetical protein
MKHIPVPVVFYSNNRSGAALIKVLINNKLIILTIPDFLLLLYTLYSMAHNVEPSRFVTYRSFLNFDGR